MDDKQIIILDRIHERHPNISRNDVLTAYNTPLVDARRENGDWISIGLDDKARDMELIYRQRGRIIVIFHALTPPTKKFINEIRSLTGRRQEGRSHER